MLVLKRKEGQRVEIIHSASGDVIRLRVYDIQAAAGVPSRANLAFDDSARNFEIRRPERRVTTPASTAGPEADRGYEPAASAIADGHDAGPFDPFTFRFVHDLPDPCDRAVS